MTDTPVQALILCGGLGTRLRPYTDHLPKPMIPVNGRPFLHNLLEQVRDMGIREVVLCTGYLGEQISAHFGDGTALGLKLRYSQGPAEWETATRLREARPLIADRFLLLYSDNFIPYNLPRAQRFHENTGKILSALVTPKEKGNLKMRPDGSVEIYDPKRAAPGLDHVELGYMIGDQRIFDHFPEGNQSFSVVLEALSLSGELAGYPTGDRYYSISDPERWKLTERYLASKKILLIDRDGVINAKAPRGEYVSSWEDFHFLEKNVEGMKLLARAGFSFLVISNQAGIGRGMLKREAVDDIHNRMVEALDREGVSIQGVYLCPHHWEDHCHCRKPAPGLFFQASREHLLRLDKTFFIGDDPRDCQAAYNAGCQSIFLGSADSLSALAPWEKSLNVMPNLMSAISTFTTLPNLSHSYSLNTVFQEHS